MKRGYTILEIVVVTTILLVIAAILYPVLAGTKTRAKEAVCISNVKQILTALELYANDNDGKYSWMPPADPVITKYMGGTALRCPVATPMPSRGYHDYSNLSAIHPELQTMMPDAFHSYEKCREIRGSDFPFVTDINHGTQKIQTETHRSIAIVGRANGSVTIVPYDPVGIFTGKIKAPCDRRGIDMNL